MRATKGLFLAIAVVAVVAADAGMAQQANSYPAYTLVMQTTYYDAKGQVQWRSTSTRYESSSGDWRSAGVVAGYEVATIYQRGHGVYQSDARTNRVIKISKHAPGCPIRTAEQLRQDPKFIRTEEILGYEGYVLAEKFSIGMETETWFIPELGGGMPFKRIYKFQDGLKITEEPLSIRRGEPTREDITGPDYQLIDQEPCFNKNLVEKLLSKPEPIYPAEARARGITGTVLVGVIVDESGHVISASTNIPLPPLHEAAIEAAYQALFSATLVDGKPVVTRGYISYGFGLVK
jgi:TonB family protein